VGSSIDRTVQSANSSIQFLLAIQPNVLHKTQLAPSQRWLHLRRAASIAACSLCTPCLVYAGVHAVQVQSVTRFLSEHMFPMRSASEDSEPDITAATCGRPVMPSASGCSNMLPCTQCLQSGAQQTPSPRMLHTLAHTVACCLIVLASCQWLQFLSSTHEA
jgi:hypothetical protein